MQLMKMVLKIQNNINHCNADKQSLERKAEDADNKIPGTSTLITNTALNTKPEDVGNKILSVSGLVTNTALNKKIREVENKIPDHTKCLTATDFNKFTCSIFDVKLREVKLATIKILLRLRNVLVKLF